MKIFNRDEIIDLPVNVVNLDDELMGITISYEPKDSKDNEHAEGEWYIGYSDAGSSISAKGKDLKTVKKNILKQIKELEDTPLRT